MPTMLASCASARSPIYRSRLFSRRKLDVRVRLLMRREIDGRMTVIYARTVDLSRSGAGLTLPTELPLGTEVLLCLRLPGCGNLMCLRSIVIRRRGFRAGLKFLEPTAAERWLLREFCDA